MSDSNAKKTAQPAREGIEQVREATQAATEATARATKEAIGRAQETLSRTTDEARAVGSEITETMARSAETTVDIAQRSAERGREVIWLGMRTAAGVNGRFVEAGYDRSQRLLEATAHALEIYTQAGESAAEKVQALFGTAVQMGRGVQQMQVAYLQLLDRTLQQASRKPQDLLRAQSIEEFAEVQRDLYLEAVNHAFEATSTLLQLAGRVAQQAVPSTQHQPRIVRP
jgi:vacuolar-type H+-ATPase subunit H